VSPRFLADENIDPDLVLGLQRRVEGIDIVRVQEVGLRTIDDPTLLGWAARENRILISRDIKTIPDFANARVAAGHAMPGVFVLAPTVSMSTAIDDLAAVAGASEAKEWVNRVIYLPLQ
jgi:predicted nuclease of predicted toxin-antitoxin system